MEPLRNRTALVGVGYTPITRNSGVTVDHLAVQACKNAIADAGLTPAEIDGVISYQMNDSVVSYDVAAGLGIPELRWHKDFYGGGLYAVTVVAEAAMSIAQGLCHTVVVYRALNGRSGFRFGKLGADQPASGENQFTLPYGYASPPQWLALWCRRHMEEYGTTERQLGAIATTCRQHASLNERAFLRAPLSLEDYLQGRWICEPFRIYDCTVEVDGGCAVVVTSAERARDLRHRPVYIVGVDFTHGPCVSWTQWPDGFTTMYGKYVGPRLWHKTGLKPSEMDFAEIYDCFTYTVLCTLEDFGFCQKGEGGPFVEEGHIRLGADLPINTHGGLLNEGYLHGLNHTCEAISQLRGDAGARQVPHARIGLVTGGAGPVGGAAIYASDPI